MSLISKFCGFKSLSHDNQSCICQEATAQWPHNALSHVMLTMPLQGWFVIRRMGLAMDNPITIFEVSISISNEGMKNEAIWRKSSGFGVISVHSKSLERWSTYKFLLTFYINCVHILHCFWDTAGHTHTHTTVLRLCGICPGQPGWAGTRRNIHPLHSSWSSIIPICFLYLVRHMASFVFNPCALQSFSTISLQVFFGLPLGLVPSTLYSIQQEIQQDICQKPPTSPRSSARKAKIPRLILLCSTLDVILQ